MNTPTTEERIRELAQDLEPVRPVPPLRGVATAVFGLWLGGFAALCLLGGWELRPRGDAVWSSPSYVAELAGLGLVAACATVAALAAAVPGREVSAHLGARAALLGLVLAIGGGVGGLVQAPPLDPGRDLGAWPLCLLRALVLALAPASVACAFLVRAAVWRPGVGIALALVGGGALGAAGVHATCSSNSALHWLVAHTLAPLAVAVALALPLAALLRQRVRRPLPARPAR